MPHTDMEPREDMNKKRSLTPYPRRRFQLFLNHGIGSEQVHNTRTRRQVEMTEEICQSAYLTTTFLLSSKKSRFPSMARPGARLEREDGVRTKAVMDTLQYPGGNFQACNNQGDACSE